MTREPKMLRDGMLTALDGVDSDIGASIIGPRSLAWGVNVQLRGGFPYTRPRKTKKTLSFATTEQEDWFEDHILQGAEFYYAPSGDGRIVISGGGRFFAIEPMFSSGTEKWEFTEITPTGTTSTTANFTVPSVDASVAISLLSSQGITVGYPIYVNGKLYVVTVVVAGKVTTGDTGIGSPTISNINTVGLVTGMTISGSGIPVGTKILTIGASTITMDQNATATASGVTLTFYALVTATNKNDTPAATQFSGATVLFLDPNRPEETMAWMEQAEQYLIIQDGEAAANIYDGATSRRADPTKKEVPTGTAMVYNEEIGRLAVAVGHNQVAFGDNVNISPTSVITFEEETVLATGGRFRIPLKYGRIVAMEMMANLDRANGQGPMIVFAQMGLSSFNLPAYRLAWQNLTYPVQINMPIRYSATGQGGVVGVNGDIFFRSKDGLRSYMYAIKDFQTPGNVPVSTEMDRILVDDEETLLDRCSAVLFDNRIIFTASPGPSRNGVYHRCLASLDFNLISRMGQKGRPAYDAIWTGIHVTKMVVGTFRGEERCMVFALNRDTLENELWELHSNVGTDQGASANRVQCAIETRAFDFGQPLVMKNLDAVFIWMDRVFGEVNVTARYRPDDYHGWFTIGTQNRHTKKEDCTNPACKVLQTFNHGYRTRIDFGMPVDEAETMDNKPARNFYHVQLRLEWTGEARIRKILVRSGQVEEDIYNLDEPDETSATERSDTSCLPDDFAYEIT